MKLSNANGGIEMVNYAEYAINSANAGMMTFCKFLSANDTGETGGHQAGIYISKPSIPILFGKPGVRGEQIERWVEVQWQNDFITKTRFVYYGKKTRNEYRITNFGRGFPFLKPEYTGALLVFIKREEEFYEGYFLNSEDEIQEFLDAFGLTPAETNRLLEEPEQSDGKREETAIADYILALSEDFPSSDKMSWAARDIYYKVHHPGDMLQNAPDRLLVEWTEIEYRLFRAIEAERYGERIHAGFSSVEEFVSMANQVLNRRKSRAGKSLEHHLAAIIEGNQISYTAQAVTEGNKKPDFLFPSEAAYHNFEFPVAGITSLAAKTTCKDRWRQVINEANRLRDENKYLCTLQQGISGAQMDEMQDEKVVLVVPKMYISTYPRDRQDRIWTIQRFVAYVKELEQRYGRY